MKGYKATDKNMQCRGYQFELGKWHEHDGNLIMCEAGFHFCDQPSGPWSFYSKPGTRIFEVEADEVLDTPVEPGAENKRVCKRIKLTREITPGGNRNTGNRNTGDGNTGNRNTGNRNTGDGNTGYWNTGNWNTGYWNTGNGNTGNRNTGYWNTGNGNTGNRNTGDGNTGNWNTGYWNTGNRNTGNRNTGDGNTGYWNATDFSSGFFCAVEPKVVSFDVQTELTRSEYLAQYPAAYDLGSALMKDELISFEKYTDVPGITPEKLLALHEKFRAARKVSKGAE